MKDIYLIIECLHCCTYLFSTTTLLLFHLILLKMLILKNQVCSLLEPSLVVSVANFIFIFIFIFMFLIVYHCLRAVSHGTF